MEALQPAHLADLTVVKQDVAVLKQDVAGLKVDMAEVRRDVAGLRRDLRGTEERLENRLDRRLAEFTRDIQRTFVTWLIASQASLTAIVAIVVSSS